ncbi:hypothetical protein CCHR01_08616 [Colletotrichum chrysophilum]|uniref:Transmembrane protein n=1 Tax=Colletotrichum chrysophilum TaxID=1836956 RepID=A0AAD9EII2_9PEZI|nr:hypothetical protein CCHR01_08616 [Colletotrichum chrysophilum]
MAYEGDQQQHLGKAIWRSLSEFGGFFFFFLLLHLLTFPFFSNHGRHYSISCFVFLESPAFSPGGTNDAFFFLFYEGAEAGTGRGTERKRRRIPKKESRTADDIPHGRTKIGTRGGVAETLFWVSVYFKLVESSGKQLSLIMTHNIKREGAGDWLRRGEGRYFGFFVPLGAL